MHINNEESNNNGKANMFGKTELFIKKILTFCLDAIFPAHCINCGQEGELLCAACMAKIAFTAQVCFACKKFSKYGHTHPQCNTANQYLPRQFLCPCLYETVAAKRLIRMLKYENVRHASNAIAQIILKFLQQELPDHCELLNQKHVVTFVPIHADKLKIRGFNQAELIAGEIANRLGWPVLDLLLKKRPTVSQTNFTKEQRQTNLKAAFEINSKYAASKELMKPLILVDDVHTTGATLAECTKTLLQSGAKEVKCLVFAREK